jgi:diacylglycerol O-acyltransferase
MERLSGLDSAFLSFETPAMHLHVAIAAVIDPSTMPEPYSFDQLKAFVSERLLADAAFRRRVVEVPFRLNHPIWVEDPHLDLDYHVRRHVLPTPGGTTATWRSSARSTTPRSTACRAPSCSSTCST